MQKLLIVIFVFYFFIPFPSRADDRQSQLQSAADSYFNNDLEKAAVSYETLVGEGYRSGALFYNLANVYYRQGRLGRAILFYRKALRESPRDADLKANLRFAVGKQKVRLDEETGSKFFRKLFFWNSFLNFNEEITLLILVNSLFWLVLLVHLFRSSEITRKCLPFAGLVLLLLVLSSGIKTYYEKYRSYGIILKPEVSVRPTFLEQQTTLLRLYEGNQVRVLGRQKLKEDSEWIQIAMPSGQRGWLKADEIGEI